MFLDVFKKVIVEHNEIRYNKKIDWEENARKTIAYQEKKEQERIEENKRTILKRYPELCEKAIKEVKEQGFYAREFRPFMDEIYKSIAEDLDLGFFIYKNTIFLYNKYMVEYLKEHNRSIKEHFNSENNEN